MNNNIRRNSCLVLSMSMLMLLVATSSASALNQDDPELVLKSHIWGKRLLPNGVAGYNDAVSISSLTANFRNGIYAYAMPYLDMKDFDWSSTSGDKMDFGIGWKGNVCGLNADLALRYFNLFDLDTMPEGDIIQPHAKLSRRFQVSECHSISPFVSLDPHLPARGGSPKKGLIVTGGLNHSWNIDPAVQINQRVNVIIDDGMCSFRSGELFEYRACLNWLISECKPRLYSSKSSASSKRSLSFDILSLRIVEPISHGFDRKRSQAILGTGLVYRF